MSHQWGINTRSKLLLVVFLSTATTIVVVLSAWFSESRLGAPLYWTWVLTGIQVLALWAAGHHRWWAWLLGAAVQLPWIAYACLTDQLGFIPGCALSAVVQTWSLVRGPPKTGRWAGMPRQEAVLTSEAQSLA